MTDPDPRRRPDARQVAARLSAPAAEPEPERRGGSRGMLVGLGLLAVLAVVVFALTRGGDEPTDVSAQPATSTVETTEAAPTEDAVEPTTDAGEGGGITIPDIPTAIPDLPDIDIPTDIPDLPEVPEGAVDDARNAWEQFTDWLGQFF